MPEFFTKPLRASFFGINPEAVGVYAFVYAVVCVLLRFVLDLGCDYSSLQPKGLKMNIKQRKGAPTADAILPPEPSHPIVVNIKATAYTYLIHIVPFFEDSVDVFVNAAIHNALKELGLCGEDLRNPVTDELGREARAANIAQLVQHAEDHAFGVDEASLLPSVASPARGAPSSKYRGVTRHTYLSQEPTWRAQATVPTILQGQFGVTKNLVLGSYATELHAGQVAHAARAWLASEARKQQVLAPHLWRKPMVAPARKPKRDKNQLKQALSASDWEKQARELRPNRPTAQPPEEN